MDEFEGQLPPFTVEAAQVVVMLPSLGSEEATGDAIDRIARAIAQAVATEREACAQLADPIETDERMSDYEKQCYDLRDVISAAIRSRP